MATALIDSSFPAISSLLEAAPSVAGTACASYMKAATALMAARLGLVERSVTVDGLPWTYLERPAVGVSTAGGRTTILLHGMSMSLHEFIPCAHALRSLPGRLLLLPYLGHDDDARPLPDGRLKRHPDVDEGTAWMLKLIEALGVVDYNLVGYSLGGSTALALAAHSHGIRRIVCLNPGFAEAVGDAEARVRLCEVYAYTDAPSARRFVDECLTPADKGYAVQGWVGELFQRAMPMPAYLRTMYEGMMASYDDHLTSKWVPALLRRGPGRAPPVLCIASEGDRVIRHEAVRRLCEEWAGAGLDVSFLSQPGYGHWFSDKGSSLVKFWSYFEATAPAVLDFLAPRPRVVPRRPPAAYPASECPASDCPAPDPLTPHSSMRTRSAGAAGARSPVGRKTQGSSRA